MPPRRGAARTRIVSELIGTSRGTEAPEQENVLVEDLYDEDDTDREEGLHAEVNPTEAQPSLPTATETGDRGFVTRDELQAVVGQITRQFAEQIDNLVG